MLSLKLGITIFITLIQNCFSQFNIIDNHNQLNLQANVLLVNKCSREKDSTKCIDVCSYTSLNDFKSFKDQETYLLDNLKIVKYDKRFEDRNKTNIKQNEKQVIDNFDDNRIFLLTDQNVIYRFIISKRLDNTVFVFNNQTKDDNCKIWILNLNLTSKFCLL